MKNIFTVARCCDYPVTAVSLVLSSDQLYSGAGLDSENTGSGVPILSYCCSGNLTQIQHGWDS